MLTTSQVSVTLYRPICFVGWILLLASWMLVNMIPHLKGRSSFSCFNLLDPENTQLSRTAVFQFPGNRNISIQFKVLLGCRWLAVGSPHQPFCSLTSSLGLASTWNCVLGQLGTSEMLH